MRFEEIEKSAASFYGATLGDRFATETPLSAFALVLWNQVERLIVEVQQGDEISIRCRALDVLKMVAAIVRVASARMPSGSRLTLESSVVSKFNQVSEARGFTEIVPADATYGQWSAINRRRTDSVFHKIEEWTPEEWMMAVCGECGELINELKKLKRGDGSPTNVAHEAGDVVAYLDLLCHRVGKPLFSEAA